MASLADKVQRLRDRDPGLTDAQIAARLLVNFKAVAAVPRSAQAVARAIVQPESVPSSLEQPESKPRRRGREAAPLRRFQDHIAPSPSSVLPLPQNHPAVTEGRTVFTSSVVEPFMSDRLLISGINSRKIGDRVSKGAWRGMPIFTLTLEERATCPRSCAQWRTCYGNAMPFARRHASGTALEITLDAELAEKQRQHPGGFVVRLHVLGDFYSEDYATCWLMWLQQFPALHVFGYTAWPEDSDVGDVIRSLNQAFPDRWVIRFSSTDPGPMRAVTIDREPEDAVVPEGIVCPAQTEATGCCGTCGMCWAEAAKDKTVVFVLHGRKSPKGRRKKAPDLPPQSSAADGPSKGKPAQLRRPVIKAPAAPSREDPETAAIDKPFVEEGDLEPLMQASRCMRLWGAVLGLAIGDALAGKDDARHFLLGRGETATWFRQVCDMAGIEPEAARERIAKKLGGTS